MDPAGLEAFYDAVPRLHGTAEEAGPFTVFIGEPGGWPLYARPRLGGSGPFDAAAVGALLERMRELDVPLAIEWVHEVTPELLDAVRRRGRSRSRSCRCSCCSTPPRRRGWRTTSSCGCSGPRTRNSCLGERRPGAGIRPADRSPARCPAARRRRSPTVRVVAEAAAVRRRADRDRRTPGARHPGRGRHLPVGDVTEVVGVATLPAEEGSGLGSAVTQVLVEDARARGIGTIFLTASSERVARIYSRLGFRRVATGYAAEAARTEPARSRDPSHLARWTCNGRSGRCPGQDLCETAMHLPHHRRSRSLGDHLFRGLANALATGIVLEARHPARRLAPTVCRRPGRGNAVWSQVDQPSGPDGPADCGSSARRPRADPRRRRIGQRRPALLTRASPGPGRTRAASRPPRRDLPARARKRGHCAGTAGGTAPARGPAPPTRRGRCPSGTTRFTSPIRSASVADTGRPVRIRSMALLGPDQPRQPHRSAVDQRHAPATAEHPEDRVVRRDPEVAPGRELEPARHRVPLDRRDHRLRQPHPRRPHRPVAVVLDPVVHRLEVRARAERATLAVQHRDTGVVIRVERQERLHQRVGRGTVHGVPRLRPIQDHGRDGAVLLDAHAHPGSVVNRTLSLDSLCFALLTGEIEA